MIIEISDNKTTGDICEKFNECFPFLKLEFYEKSHHWYEESSTRKKVPHEKQIGEIRKKHPHGTLEIRSSIKTGELEQVFKDKFDLNVQVFRHHGNEWVQTVGSDKLTLKEQNEIGSKASINSEHIADSKTERENLF